MKRLLFVLPAVALLAACGTPATFSDGYREEGMAFHTNPAYRSLGFKIISPGIYRVVDPTGTCRWDARDKRIPGEYQDQDKNGFQVTLGDEHRLGSTKCGTWQRVETEAGSDYPR